MSDNEKRKRSHSACNDEFGDSTTESSLCAIEKRDYIQVHRCRFVEITPQSIQAISFHASGNLLAVARSGGNVEVWDTTPGARWYLLHVIPGSRDREISSLLWSRNQSNRLFVTSLHGFLWEIDTNLFESKREMDSNGGPVWCSAMNEQAQQLAIGCEDGRIRIFSIEDDAFYFRKLFVNISTRIVSLTWDVKTNVIFSGSEDGIIYKWDATSGRNTLRITLESMGKAENVVWSLAILNDQTLISGDALGHLCFWDAPTGTLSQKCTHLTADILTICTDEDSLVYAAGVDGNIAMYRKNKVESSGDLWSYTYTQNAHTHDVRALALSPQTTANLHRRLLVSGGLDTQIVSTRIDLFQKTSTFRIPRTPYRDTISLAVKKRYLLVQYTNHLNLYQLPNVKLGKDTLLLQIKIKNQENLTCSAISSDGRMIACATTKCVKIFDLIEEDGRVNVQKSKAAQGIHGGADLIKFSSDCTRLVLVMNASSVGQILDLKTHAISQEMKVEKDGAYRRFAILSVSHDDRWIVIVDTMNDVWVYRMDTMQQYCRFPRQEIRITNIGFNASDSVVIATLASDTVVMYDINSQQLSEWFRQHANEITESLFSSTVRNLIGFSCDSSNPSRIYLYAYSCLLKIDMAYVGEIGKDASLKSEEKTLPFFCSAVDRYRPIAFAGCIGTKEMIIVETPWYKARGQLPDSLYRIKYGK